MTAEHEATTLQPDRYYKAITMTGSTPCAWEQVEAFDIPDPIRWTLDDHTEYRYVSVHHELTSDHYRVER